MDGGQPGEILFTSRMLWVGFGSQRGVSQLSIHRAIEWVFRHFDLDLDTIAGIATIDLKADEVGLIDYCRQMGWFLKIYSPERLHSVTVVRSSALVAQLVQTASVAEAAALCAAHSDVLLVPKQKFRLDDRSGWVTIAVAVEPVDLMVQNVNLAIERVY